MTPPDERSSRRDFLAGRAAKKELVRLVEETAPRSVSPAASSFPNVTPQPAPPLLHVSREAMACEFEIFFDPVRYPSGADVSVVALDLIAALEDQLTVYRDTSEVARLNAIASFRAVPVERGLFDLLQKAKTLSEQTKGAFDVTAGQLSKTWGFYRREGKMPSPAEVEEAIATVGYEQLQLYPDSQAVEFGKPGMELNLGAIGKGYALDRAADLLREKDLHDCLLHGGNSSVLARGHRGGESGGWTIALKHPLRPSEGFAEFILHNQALGTSGSGTQYFHHAGKRYGHIIDPRTGWPADKILSSTVIAPTAAEADALSTALYVMSLDEAAAFAQARPDVAALLTTVGKHPGEIDVHPFNLADKVTFASSRGFP